jgi:uncharacterized protein YjbJ (UPF0337 family)
MDSRQVTKTKPKRITAMRSSTRDNVEGKMRQAKGKLKEAAGRMVGNRDLQAEGKEENIDGKVQEKRGQIKKVLGR